MTSKLLLFRSAVSAVPLSEAALIEKPQQKQDGSAPLDSEA
jgi:hypothetical protein